MILHKSTIEDVDVVELTGRLVVLDAQELREKIVNIIKDGNGKLVIDMQGVSFVDSSGLSVFISALKAMEMRQGRLVLSALTPSVQSLIELTRLHHIFEIFLTKEAAIEILK